MKKYDVVIIGGGPSAIVTGLTIRKFNPEKTVLMIKEESDGLVPCGIPYVFHLLGNDTDKNKMGPKPFVDLGGVVLIDKVIKVDKISKSVITHTGEQFQYDKLVFATGSVPIVPANIKGTDLQNVFYIKKSYGYIKTLAEVLAQLKKVVIVGGGFIGAEVAEQLACNGLEVTLVESESACFSKAFSPELSELATQKLKETSVRVITSTMVNELKGDQQKVKQVTLSTGETIETDAVILSIGYRSNSELAKEAGIELNRYGDIHVDNYGRTNNPDISAVGDCAQTFGFLTGRSDLIKLASTATAEARVLGHNIFGVKMKKSIQGTLAVFSTEINGLAMAATGANDQNATDSGIAFVSAKFTSPNRHPGSLPGADKLTVKLYASPVDGTIIGGEVWGGTSAGEIINTISMAIQKSITVYELVSFQVGTHPLLTASPVVNPLIRAGEEILLKLCQPVNTD